MVFYLILLYSNTYLCKRFILQLNRSFFEYVFGLFDLNENDTGTQGKRFVIFQLFSPTSLQWLVNMILAILYIHSYWQYQCSILGIRYLVYFKLNPAHYLLRLHFQRIFIEFRRNERAVHLVFLHFPKDVRIRKKIYLLIRDWHFISFNNLQFAVSGNTSGDVSFSQKIQ